MEGNVVPLLALSIKSGWVEVEFTKDGWGKGENSNSGKFLSKYFRDSPVARAE
jgi:hypothetical protein